MDIYTKAVEKRREFKLARENFFREQLMLYKNDHVNFWKRVYELLGNQSTTKIDCIFNFGTEHLLGIEESVQELNSYFALWEREFLLKLINWNTRH